MFFLFLSLFVISEGFFFMRGAHLLCCMLGLDVSLYWPGVFVFGRPFLIGYFIPWNYIHVDLHTHVHFLEDVRVVFLLYS